jgi:surface protein
MRYMFSGCTNLTSLDVSKFNTNSVKRMDSMFYKCSGLTSLDLSGFVTSSSTEMRGIFQECTSLTSVFIPEGVSYLSKNVFTYYDSATKTNKPLENLNIYCYANTYAATYEYGDPIKVHEIYTYPTNIKVDYSEQYHQIRFTWDKVEGAQQFGIEGAQQYGIAVYLAGKWRIQTQKIPASTTSYITPKNLTPGKTYKVAIAARVNGRWDATNAIKNAVTVTVK